jgi:hypothetical protein
MRRVDICVTKLTESLFARNVERDTGVAGRRADDFENADISATSNGLRYILTVAPPSIHDSNPL